MLTTILTIVVLVFIAWSIWTQYQATPITDSVAKRVWASLLAGIAALAVLISQWFHTPTP